MMSVSWPTAADRDNVDLQTFLQLQLNVSKQYCQLIGSFAALERRYVRLATRLSGSNVRKQNAAPVRILQPEPAYERLSHMTTSLERLYNSRQQLSSNSTHAVAVIDVDEPSREDLESATKRAKTGNNSAHSAKKVASVEVKTEQD